MTTPVTPAVRLPAGDLTPHGWWHIANDTRPMMRLRAYDGSVDIYLMGGLAPPFHDPMLPEAVAVVDLKGLIPPWRHIDQKGATEDGVTQIDALYDPIEVQLVADCIARNSPMLRRTYRYLIDSIDAKQESELSWFTQELGYWWAPVRWFQGAPPDPMMRPQMRRQRASLRLRADNGFWRSYDDTALFRFVYDDMVDEFKIDYRESQDLGPNWPQRYTGTGGGYCSTIAGDELFLHYEEARWFDGTPFQDREVVNGPFKDFHTETDNQVVQIELGSIPDYTFQVGCFNDMWARMNRDEDGNWAGDGIRARIGLQGLFGWIELTRFNDFVPTPMYARTMLIPPLFYETYTLVCGADGDPRMFRVMRGGLPILSHKEVGAGSALGEDHRGVGWGMHAGPSVFGQKTPAAIKRISAGDNATVTQSGFLKRTNVGDQPMYDDITFFGPGKVRIYDGPGSEEYVEFGPLLPNQIVLLRTDPRKRQIEDLTSIPPTPQHLNAFQAFLKQFESFAFGNNVPPLITQINSLFGIAPPQGNFYQYLNGRFSDNYAIPAKSPGNPAKPYYVKVEIVDGNADSKVLAAGTPLRRYPI
ncbi:MAG: hypothetical protein VYA67_21920 [Actinomycetota bacterium]|nr:hypothetical protein [Actinomycetota bacterium]